MADYAQFEGSEWRILLHAARLGDLAPLRAFVDRGGNINGLTDDGGRPVVLLDSSVVGGQAEATSFLLKNGAVASAGHLVEACGRANDVRNAKLLLDAGADPRALERRSWNRCTFQSTPLHFAIRGLVAPEEHPENRIAIIRQLMERGADIHTPDSVIDPPAVGAAPPFYVQHPLVAQFLIDSCGVDFSLLRNGDGSSPLFVARSKDIAAFLIEKGGVDPHMRNNKGQTALHGCVSHWKATAVVRYLTDVVGLDPDAVDNDGFRPIHYACMGGGSSSVIALIERGAYLGAEALAGPMPPGAYVATLDESLADLLQNVHVDLFRAAYLDELFPIPTCRRAVRWALDSPAVADINTREPPVVGTEIHTDISRDFRLGPLRNDAWERRKQVVCAFFLLRQARKEGKSTYR